MVLALAAPYRAVIEGHLHICNEEIEITEPIDDKKAASRIRLLKRLTDDASSAPISLIEVDLLTGRKHQIRKHLAGLGHPILGDRLYGAQESELDLQLCAFKLTFTCPISNQTRCFDLSNYKVSTQMLYG